MSTELEIYAALNNVPDCAKGSVTRHVVCAANRYGDILVCSARHHDSVMNAQIKQLKDLGVIPKNPKRDQGFIDQFGVFMNRVDAAFLVKHNGQQLRDPNVGYELYSENLY